jgi:GDP/UDP-N,N'-diacetylbacillosamine 2-epimerase (hydrolysing)
MKRKICVVTGSRADYGLLKHVMKKIVRHDNLLLQLVVTGMHLSSIHGKTLSEIENDGFQVDIKVPCLSNSDTAVAIAQATGRTVAGCAAAFSKLKPDLVLVLGDRFEILAASTAALLSKIPIAHIHGGEVTVGAYDDAIRHSITKMSNFHFVATSEYKKRVAQLGEDPKNIFICGGLGVDAIKELKLLTRNEIEDSLGLKFSKRSLLITFHPTTLDDEPPQKQMSELLKVLSTMIDTTLIFTMPNADTGGVEIIKEIREFVSKNKNAFCFDSLGQLMYLSCMANVDGVIGNSSSGILEAPSLGVGTINIGDRQLGRIQAESIINAEPTAVELFNAFEKLYAPEFQEQIKTCRNPYGDGGASTIIANILNEIELVGISKKSFYDIPFADEIRDS